GDPLMYSRVHRSSRLFAVRILAAAACLLTVAGSAGVATPTASADAAACPHLPANVACHENWMADMASYIGQRPISQVILPGSHDSGTYGKFALPIQTGESQTQDLNIEQQLEHGVRVFDLRAEPNCISAFRGFPFTCNDMWVNHGTDVTFESMGTITTQLDNFTASHPREIVILKMDMEAMGNYVQN